MARLNHVPVPTIALVQGGCFGGGTGLVAACDVVIAADNAMFSIAEVRWGLTAAIIVPQLNDAIGVRQLRRYALTGERFNAEEARRIGLVHEVVPLAELAAAGERVVGHVLENGPDAIAQTKALTLKAAFGDLDDSGVRGADREPRGQAAVGGGRRGACLVRREARGEVGADEGFECSDRQGVLPRPLGGRGREAAVCRNSKQTYPNPPRCCSS